MSIGRTTLLIILTSRMIAILFALYNVVFCTRVYNENRENKNCVFIITRYGAILLNFIVVERTFSTKIFLFLIMYKKEEEEKVKT